MDENIKNVNQETQAVLRIRAMRKAEHKTYLQWFATWQGPPANELECGGGSYDGGAAWIKNNPSMMVTTLNNRKRRKASLEAR